MPISNTQGQFNVGRDITVVVMASNGQQLTIPNITDFEQKQITAPINVDRLDGIQMNAELPKGWSGMIGFERGSEDVDIFIQNVEDAWFNNGSYQVNQIYTYISECDGSQSIFVFDNVAFVFSDAGSWKGDSSVKCKLDFRANRRQMIG